MKKGDIDIKGSRLGGRLRLVGSGVWGWGGKLLFGSSSCLQEQGRTTQPVQLVATNSVPDNLQEK